MRKFSNKIEYSKGVTLIELLVVISILVIMSATVLASYGKFKSTMSIQNLADDIALSVRKAQGYAIGVARGVDGYGVHFTIAPSTNPSYIGSRKAFIIFNDIIENNRYDYENSGGGSGINSCYECLEILNIGGTDEIYSINYFIYRSGSFQPNPVLPKGSLDILFNRPKPEPTFCYRNNASSNSDCNMDSSRISYVEIKVQNTKNLNTYRTITIRNNGQISVSQ